MTKISGCCCDRLVVPPCLTHKTACATFATFATFAAFATFATFATFAIFATFGVSLTDFRLDALALSGVFLASDGAMFAERPSWAQSAHSAIRNPSSPRQHLSLARVSSLYLPPRRHLLLSLIYPSRPRLSPHEDEHTPPPPLAPKPPAPLVGSLDLDPGCQSPSPLCSRRRRLGQRAGQ